MAKEKSNPYWVVEGEQYKMHGPFATVGEASLWGRAWLTHHPWRIVIELSAVQKAVEQMQKLI
jgi:hypothetical protein